MTQQINPDDLEKNIQVETDQEQISENQENTEHELENPLGKIQEELNKEKDKFLRLFAEFENYKKRTAKERIELFSTASEGVMVSLLPVLDDFDRALQQTAASEENKDIQGFLLIANKLNDILTSKGLKLVELNNGETFNADLAEAVTQIPAGEDMKGKIVDVIEKGYCLGEKIIRFPKVVIGQ